MRLIHKLLNNSICSLQEFGRSRDTDRLRCLKIEDKFSLCNDGNRHCSEWGLR